MAGHDGHNDGGIVLVLFLMAITIAAAMFRSVALYVEGTAQSFAESKERRTARLTAGFANIGNGTIHALLVVYMKANEGNTAPYWVAERRLGGIEGPAGLMVINLIVGVLALRADTRYLSGGCNTFIAIIGTAMPIVWYRFVSEGLTSWPNVVIFIWFFIFAMELAAFTSSLAWCAIPLKDKGKAA